MTGMRFEVCATGAEALGAATDDVTGGGMSKLLLGGELDGAAGFLSAVCFMLRELQRAMPTTTARTAKKKMARDRTLLDRCARGIIISRLKESIVLPLGSAHL